jgi:hypothetical protein
MLQNRRQLILAITLGALSLAGCSATSDTLQIQSDFSYPNGDYASLGHAHAEQNTTRLFFDAPVMTKEVYVQLKNDALTKTGGDDLIDYLISTETTNYILITTTRFSLDGTAIKVTRVGGQIYNKGQAIPSPTRTAP